MKNYLTIILLFLTANYHLLRAQIYLDENFSDWNLIPAAYNDPAGDSNGGIIDFKNFQITDDDRYIFFKIETGGEIIIQESNEFTIYIDTDYNTSTGIQIKGIGADFEFTFGDRDGKFYGGGTTYTIHHDDIGLISSPTYSSNTFEIAFSKSAEASGNRIFSSNSIRIVLRDNRSGGDELPEENGGVEYELKNLPAAVYTDYSLKKTNESNLRILSYNVLRDNLFEGGKVETFRKIISAIEPDIIGFVEIYNHSSAETAGLISGFFPGSQWYHAKLGYDLVALSRFPIISQDTIHTLDDYKAGGAFLLDLHPKYDGRLLLIVAHPKSSGGETNNNRRQNQIDAIMAFIRDAKSGGGNLTIDEDTPIIICGDMNLVGYSAQLKTFLNGDIINNEYYGPDFNPDWDNTSFDDAKPYVTNLPFTFSWYDPPSEFSPGRLDYIFYSGSVMEEVNSFSLFTDALPADTLNLYGLSGDDIEKASDHLPLVADFHFTSITGIDKQKDPDVPENFQLYQNYPNPFNPGTVISFRISVPGVIRLKIFDTLGKETSEILNEYKNPGFYKIDFDASSLSSGMYFYQIQADDLMQTKKMVLLR